MIEGLKTKTDIQVDSSIIRARFDDVFELYLGKTPSRGKQSYWGGHNTWVSIGDMSCGKYISSTKEGITDTAVEDTGIHQVKKGTVIMSFKLSIGKVCIADTDLYTNEAIMAFVTKPLYSILPDYLYYYLMAYKWECGNEVVKGVTLNKKTISASTITFPKSLYEQQRIVDILDAEFEKIDTLKENAERNLQNAKVLFQSVLRKELEPKEGWKTVSIGDIADLKGGKRVPKGYKLETESTGYPYIRVADFNENGSIDMDDIHYISKAVYEGIKRYIITTDDVYISIAGTIGKSGIIPRELNGANLTENACRLVLKGDINNKYIYYCTIDSQFKAQITKLTMQAAQPKLALTRLSTVTISVPPRSIQDKIVEVISGLNDRCKALQENYEKTVSLCNDLKQSLLRKAFSGEL